MLACCRATWESDWDGEVDEDDEADDMFVDPRLVFVPKDKQKEWNLLLNCGGLYGRWLFSWIELKLTA